MDADDYWQTGPDVDEVNVNTDKFTLPPMPDDWYKDIPF